MQHTKKYFKYNLCGIVVDSKKSIIKVFNFVIDLSNDYPNGFGILIKDGDYVEFEVDRIDCTLGKYKLIIKKVIFIKLINKLILNIKCKECGYLIDNRTLFK